jgi:hypothetical protein
MGRPKSADICREPHAERSQVILCGRKLGHAGDHGHGAKTWPRRIERPPSGSSTAASPMR